MRPGDDGLPALAPRPRRVRRMPRRRAARAVHPRQGERHAAARWAVVFKHVRPPHPHARSRASVRRARRARRATGRRSTGARSSTSARTSGTTRTARPSRSRCSSRRAAGRALRRRDSLAHGDREQDGVRGGGRSPAADPVGEGHAPTEARWSTSAPRTRSTRRLWRPCRSTRWTAWIATTARRTILDRRTSPLTARSPRR